MSGPTRHHSRLSKLEPCHPESEPLRSTRREDGLWTSIEHDEDGESPPPTQDKEAARPESTQEIRGPRQDTRLAPVKDIGTQTQTRAACQVVEPPVISLLTPPKTSSPLVKEHSGTPRGDRLNTTTHHSSSSVLAVAEQRPPEPESPSPSSPFGKTQRRTTAPKRVSTIRNPSDLLKPLQQEKTQPAELASPPSLTQPPPPPNAVPAKRRRGRPRKSDGGTGAPPQRRRRVRFSDPGPPDELRARESHVFVRLTRVVVEFERDILATGGEGQGQGQPARAWMQQQQQQQQQRQRRWEFVWNNRAKGWKPAGERSDDNNLVSLAGLFERSPAGNGVVLQPVVLPIESGGVRQSMEMQWDEGGFCFQGVNHNGETLSIALGEMRDMARNPWGRQFVGYTTG